jgi:hypothetical protein
MKLKDWSACCRACTAATDTPFVDHQPEMEEGLRQAPPAPQPDAPLPARWTLRRVRDSFDWLHGYTLSGVWRVLRRLKIGWRAGRPQRFSPDPAYADKVTHLLACLQAAARYPQQTVVLFLDEMGFFRWPDSGQDWMPLAPAPPRLVACANNNRQWRIIGVLNALTGQVNYLDNYIVGRKVVGQMYHYINHLYPHAEQIYIVQDNWSIHNHAEVLAELDSLPRLETVWLPTYAPWLNPIEKLWRWLRQDVLRLHPWAADWDRLLQQVHTFLDQFAQPSPHLLRYVGLLGDGKLATAIRYV